MDIKEAVLVASLCMAADELGTHAMLRAGARETMIQRREVRWGLKLSILPLFAKKQKKKAAWWVVPVVYCGAGAWNGLVVAPEQRRRNVGEGGR